MELETIVTCFTSQQHTISIPLKQEMTSRDIRTLFQDRYAGEKLVKITGEAPLVRAISGKHGVVSESVPCGFGQAMRS